jgi:pseudaminic acid biosynthesis-associated methylase
MAEAYKTPQEKFWAEEFGKEYIQRNKSNEFLASNLNFFSRALKTCSAIGSAIELGCNIGMNVQALKLLFPSAAFCGVEINKEAYDQFMKIANVTGFNQSLFDFKASAQYDLSLIKGVLIHINPEMLPIVYEKLYEASRKYILIAEYYNPTPVAIPYRGHADRLFKRDFAGEFLDRFKGVELIDYGFAYKRDPLFPQDDITWFLLRK